MNCSRCGTENPANHGFCSHCGNELRAGDTLPSAPAKAAAGGRRVSTDNDVTIGGIILPPVPQADVGTLTPPGATPPAADSREVTVGPWAVGRTDKGDNVDFGPRYRLGRMLGEGGMGAVYEAYDKELDRTVALKLVRPGLADNPIALQRFKQELLLASKISHKNILRIHDLGEYSGTRFISMAYIEGEDLYRLLARKGKLPLEHALNIARQLCAGLEAAHSEGVVHRDFKPQNILLDAEDHAYISDFGLSKSLDLDQTGMTRSGEMLGTPRYMAPEQVEGGKIDHRVDIYALGLIMYEMLTGDIPFQADSTVQLIYKHVNELPRSPRELNPEIPEWLARVIMKCLEKSPEARYASAAEVLEAIETATAPPRIKGRRLSTTRLRALPPEPVGIALYWKYASVAVIVVAIAIGGFYAKRRAVPAHQPHKPVTVLVADFTNHTGDPIFDGTLEPMFNVALEGASFVNAFNRGTARKLAAKIPGAGERLDERTARLIAVSQGVSAVLIGSLARSGNDYRISVDAVDAVTGKTIAHREVSASTKDSVLMAIPKLAAPIRNALGDTTPESEQLAATQGSFATSNLEAVHQFGMGMEQQFAGNMEAALKSFSNAAELDPNFARAYAGMAAVAGNLGQRQNAEKYAKLAMEHVDRMTERERYRIRGLYYIRTGNWQKCVEEYSELTKQYPSDNIGQNNLASCYARLENMPKAMEEAQRAVDIAPKDVMARMNFALYACYAGDFPTCGRDGHEVLQLNPSFEQAFLVIAYAQLGQGQLREATETYKKLQEVSAHGASLAASGLANIALYEGKYREAIRILEKGVAADLAATNRDAAADKFSMLAYAKISVGEKPAAVAAGRSALRESQTAKTQFLVARTFVEAGEIQQARKLATSLASEVQGPPQTYAKIILGEAALKDHKFSEAIQLFGEANKLINTWIGHFDLGRAYLEANAFAEADSEFDECIKRRGEALELFMDDMPTYSYFPPVYYYQGRVREGLKSPGFRDSYRMYLNIRGSAAEDSLLAEINHRLAR